MYMTTYIQFSEHIKVLYETVVWTEVAQNFHKELWKLWKILGRREESHICLIYEVSQTLGLLSLVPVLVMFLTKSLFNGLIANYSSQAQLKPSSDEWVWSISLRSYTFAPWLSLLCFYLPCWCASGSISLELLIFKIFLSLGLIITEDMYDMSMNMKSLICMIWCM